LNLKFFKFFILSSDLTTRSERAEKEKADMQKKMAAYKQQYEDLLGSVSQHLKLISSCVEAEKMLRCDRKKESMWRGGGIVSFIYWT
jgi:hypothetical protein